MIITLTTDFGLADAYVAAMKGVILGLNPQVTLVDISHSLPPQDVLSAAFILHTSHPFFPEGTIHVTVVDPGVGSPRRPIALATPRAIFIAPDNGLLSYIIAEAEPPPEASPFSGFEVAEKKLPPGLRAFHLNKPQYWRHPVSHTFHGRDIFAPVAAHLSLGVLPEETGEAIPSLSVFSIPRPQPQPDGGWLGHIQHMDAFGNLITDISVRHGLSKAEESHLLKEDVVIDIAGHRIGGLSASYAAGKGLLAIIGSSGYVEIAYKNGHAARYLGAKVGDSFSVRFK